MTTKIDTIHVTAQAQALRWKPLARDPFWLRALNWLADRDAAYRSAQKLRSMPDERLDDMGITREQAKTQ
ncbi:MAG TPA: hypothetical protein DIU07_06345 [Rhodobacteraceae bacterium]|nr:hypothetical protein [Paracoccaceae bacterium]